MRWINSEAKSFDIVMVKLIELHSKYGSLIHEPREILGTKCTLIHQKPTESISIVWSEMRATSKVQQQNDNSTIPQNMVKKKKKKAFEDNPSL